MFSCLTQGFPSHPGLVCGVVMAGYYFGYMGSTLVQMLYLNPSSLQSDDQGYFTEDELLDRVPGMFLWLALVTMALQLSGITLISRPEWSLDMEELLTDLSEVC